MMNNVNCLLHLEIIEMGKMESGRALQKSLFIRNACGYKAKLVLGFFILNFTGKYVSSFLFQLIWKFTCEKKHKKKYLLKFLGRFLPSKRGLKTIGFEKILSVI